MDEPVRIILLGEYKAYLGEIRRLIKSAGLNADINGDVSPRQLVENRVEYKDSIVMVFYPSDGIGKEEANNIVKVGIPDSRFIIITGRDKEQEARELVKSGAEDYVFIDEILRLQTSLVKTRERQLLTSELEKLSESLDIIRGFNRIVGRNSRDLICMLDVNGYILSFNPSFEKLLGIKPEKLKGSNFFALLHPDDSQFVINSFHEAMVKVSGYSSRFRIKQADGGWKTFEASGEWMNGTGAEPRKFVMVLRDISRESEAENEIKKARLKQQDAVRQRSSFLSAVSHEIRTPLNVILGYTSMLKDFYNDQQEMNFHFYNNIERASKRLLNIITQILDMSKIESGEFHLNLEPLSLNFAVKAAAEMVKAAAMEKNLSIEMHVPEKEIFILADEYCLNGIITNLLNNAIKYSDNGLINIKISKEKQQAKLVVEDEGIGIHEDYISQLFQPFSQEDYSTTRKFEGAGLGLALTKSFVELLKGSIEVKSQKAKGTRFTVSLPVTEKIIELKKPSRDE